METQSRQNIALFHALEGAIQTGRPVPEGRPRQRQSFEGTKHNGVDMMQAMVIKGSGLVLGVFLLAVGQPVGSTSRQQPVAAQTLDVESIGPKTGDALPEFSLHDQDGKVHTLKSLLGTNGAVIVFFRSADW